MGYQYKEGKLEANVDLSKGFPEFEFYGGLKAYVNSMTFENTIKDVKARRDMTTETTNTLNALSCIIALSPIPFVCQFLPIRKIVSFQQYCRPSNLVKIAKIFQDYYGIPIQRIVVYLL